MKKILIMSAVLVAALTSCTKEVQTNELNYDSGWYSVDLHSVSESGHFGGIDEERMYTDLCKIAFDGQYVYTLTMDDSVTCVPELGFLYQTDFVHGFVFFGEFIIISNEEWAVGEQGDKLTLTRTTDYYGMGKDIQTLILTEL